MRLLPKGLVQLWISILILILTDGVSDSYCADVPQIRIYELNSGNLTMLEDPPNTDVALPTNHDNPDRYLILQCRAPYPVQWIYGGDGIPEFITNTTVSWETEPKEFIASAGLFRLFEHHTGTYSCRSINTPHLSSFYHLYFTGENLLSLNTGDTIYFSRHDPTVRIPCSVSDPKAHVTLQKLVDGYVNCPVNDSISYNKKMGFTLKVSNDYQPYGDYICIAHTKGRFSVLEFKIIMEENDSSKQDGPGQSQNRPGPQLMPALKPARPSISTSDAFSTPASNYHPRPTNPSLRPSNPHFSPRPEIPSSSPPNSAKCDSFTCGRNAQCLLNASDRPVCKCEPHFKGDPYIRCYPECIIDSDCPRNRYCFDNACENPCPSACGVSPSQLLSCTVSNHSAVCTYHHCNPSPCGPYSECRHLQRGAVCSCLPGTYGKPPHCSRTNLPPSQEHEQGYGFGNFRTSTTTLRVTSFNNTETITTSKPNVNKPKPSSKPKPNQNKNPKPKPGHKPASIPEGPITHPNYPIDLQLQKDIIDEELIETEPNNTYAVNTDEIFDLESEVDFDPDSCRVHTDCNITHKCVDRRCRNPCEPNPCGRSTICRVKMHEPICTCSPGFIRVNQYCLITNCKSNRDCPETKTCVRNKCINPCAGYCGKNSVCIVQHHSPGCQCQAGFTGDPFKDCSRLQIETTRATDLEPEEPRPLPESLLSEAEQESVSSIFSVGAGADDPFESLLLSPPKQKTTLATTTRTTTMKTTTTTTTTNAPELTQAPTVVFSVPTPGVVQPLITKYKHCGQVLKCGTNARCVYNVSSSASYCQCEDGFFGDPNRICYLKIVKPDELAPTPSEEFIEIGNIFNGNSTKGSSLILSSSSGASRIKIKNKNNNNNRGPVASFCVRDSDCPRDKSCIGDACLNPCTFASLCGENQDCEVREHKATCQCREGYPVKIYNNCYPQESSYNSYNSNNFSNTPSTSCDPNPCGENSECSVTKVAPYVSCKCRPSMVGRPPNCRSTCVVDYECPDKLACVDSTCQDPCEGVCGYLARCRVYQHQAKCFCPQGFKLLKENGVIKCIPPLFPDSNSRFNTNHELVYGYGTGDPYSVEQTSTDPTYSDKESFSETTANYYNDMNFESELLATISKEILAAEAKLKAEKESEFSKETKADGTLVKSTFNLKENLDKIGNQNPEKNNEFNAKLGIAFDGGSGSSEHFFKRNENLKDQNLFDNPIFPMPTVPFLPKTSKEKKRVSIVSEKVTDENGGNKRKTFQGEEFDDSDELGFI